MRSLKGEISARRYNECWTRCYDKSNVTSDVGTSIQP